MLTLDGSAGGGSLVRTALALSALSGESFRIENIRGARSNPGLRPQHLAAVRVMAEICNADVSGAVVNARSMEFWPGELQGGTVDVDIGTAGSIPLLFDAVLPLSVDLDSSLTLAATGGTDVKWSPSSAYFECVKLPLLRRIGVDASVAFERTGFYPKGGGRARLRVEPSEMQPLAFAERGAFAGARIYSKASTELEQRSVADRQADTAVQVLGDAGMGVVERHVTYVDTYSPGSAIGMELRYEHTRAGFDALGERGKPSEEVGREAADAAVSFENGPAAVDAHMADQLLVFLGLVGGEMLIPRVTEHVKTGQRLLRAFGVDLSLRAQADGTVLVRCPTGKEALLSTR